MSAHPRLHPALNRGVRRTLLRGPAIAAGLLSLFVLVLGIRYGSFVAGGSDPYGYVSQALLWEKGNLHVFQPLAPALPWPDALLTLTPLGYAPAPNQRDIVPTYSPGLPLLMVVFRKAFGANGQFYVVPVLGALAVWLTFLLGRRLTGRSSVGISAAIVLATCPPFLYMLMAPMSDVPVAAAWTLALLLALSGTAAASIACGLVAAVAILIRPNLVPVAAVIGVSLLWRSMRAHGWQPRALLSPTLFACAVAPGIAAVALVNSSLYGSAFRSGYGNLSDLYALGNFATNLSRYTRWLFASGCAYVLLGTAAAFLPWPRIVRTRLQSMGGATRVLLAGFLVVVWLSYLFYQSFHEWWYLRFLLPVFPVTIVLAAALMADVIDHLQMRMGWAVLVGVAIVLFATGYHTSSAYGVFGFHVAEARYAQAGAYVARRTDARAIILSMQHSGSLRYYSGRTTVRYDMLDPSRLDEQMETLLHMRFHPYIVIEDGEVQAFKGRFVSQVLLGELDWPAAEAAPGVRMWDVAERFRKDQRGAAPAPPR